MTGTRSRLTIPLLVGALAASCGGPRGETPQSAAPRCVSLDDCAQHERECRYDAQPACETCAGIVPICSARSADEITTLDRDRDQCVARPHGEFSYADGCRCTGPDCPSPRQWCEAGGDTYTDELGCMRVRGSGL